jgi:hypothetical protein
MSPDWSAKEEPVPYAKLVDPQSLNLYAYVYNNPINSIDSDGHDGCSATPQLCASIRDAVSQGKSIQDGAMSFLQEKGKEYADLLHETANHIPARLERVGDPKVYSSDNPLKGRDNVSFAGTEYSFKVIAVSGQPITEPMIVKEVFSDIDLAPGTSVPGEGSWNFVKEGGGELHDFVGAKIYQGNGPSPLPKSFSDLKNQGYILTQRFRVILDSGVTTLSTVNRLQVKVGPTGNVTGQSTNSTP